MRVYLPSTLGLLAQLVAEGRVPEHVERFTAVDEDEESEYAALTEAAEAAAGLLTGPGRRVVVVAEVPDPSSEVTLALVEAVHADTVDVDPQDEDLPELAWFATQEIEDLIASR